MESLGYFQIGMPMPFPSILWQDPTYEIPHPYDSFYSHFGTIEGSQLFSVERESQAQTPPELKIADEEDEIVGPVEYNRKQKSLEELSKRVLNYFGNEQNLQFGLETIIQQINVERRRVYDIINIYQSLGIVKKLARKNYLWNGFGLFEQKLIQAASGGRTTANEVHFGPRPFQELTMNFLQLMSQRLTSTTLQNAAESLSSKTNLTIHINFKTMVRRLYDITNVLMSLGVVKKIRVNKRQEFEWLGIRGLVDRVGPIESESIYINQERTPSFFKQFLIANEVPAKSSEQEVKGFISKWSSCMWETVDSKRDERGQMSPIDFQNKSSFIYSNSLGQITNFQLPTFNIWNPYLQNPPYGTHIFQFE